MASCSVRFVHLVMLSSFGVCIDYTVHILIPCESIGALVATFLVALAKAVLVSNAFLLTWRHVETSYANATAFAAWSCSTILLAFVIFVSGGVPSQARSLLIVLGFLRLVDAFVIKGSLEFAAYKDAEQKMLIQEVRARVSRLCTLYELQKSSAASSIDLTNLACCVCLGDISPKDTIGVRHCSHVAHVICDYKFDMSRSAQQRDGGSSCPMHCKELR
eukprot:TRINITY_DN39952_c0_g1_i1.p1 TRINITY_DN39952_c0_g1~~TRINITY_DN39952_c0_g1_i1.p1  ORF type:complete len:236 (-),score=25.96 TRINITY_DN39952_c0_g1_i1:259-912(-)